MSKHIYDNKFFEILSPSSSKSATAVVPLIMEIVRPRSVVDVGCGVGTWLKVFLDYGVKDIFGFDGEYVDRRNLLIPNNCFQGTDLCGFKPKINRSFDLALCLEVAEHVPENEATSLIDFLVSLAPVVCFSAAVPGQGGTGHLNEQWPDYWSRIFADRGYMSIDVLRTKIWNIAEVEPWYCQNMFLFVKEIERSKYTELTMHQQAMPNRVIHPELFLRFASLEYVKSKQILRELCKRLVRKLLFKIGG